MTAKIFLGQTSQAQFAAQRQALYECAGSARVYLSLIIIITFCLDTDGESGVKLTTGVEGQGQERQ